MLTALTILMAVVAAEPKAAEAKPFHDLGERFVESLRKEDAKAYAACWVSIEMIRKKSQNLKNPIPAERLQVMEKYIADRDEKVAKSFETLSNHLRKHGSLKDLKLIDIGTIGKIKEGDDGIRSVSHLDVTIGQGEAKYKVEIDDGAEVDGKWYFSDKPMQVNGPGKNEGASFRD